MSPSSRQLRNYLCIPSLGSSNGIQHTIWHGCGCRIDREKEWNWTKKRKEYAGRHSRDRNTIVSSSSYRQVDIFAHAHQSIRNDYACVSLCTTCVSAYVFVIPFYCCRFSSVSIVAAVWPTFAHKSINNHIVCNSIRESTKRSPVVNSIPTRISPFSLRLDVDVSRNLNISNGISSLKWICYDSSCDNMRINCIFWIRCRSCDE